MLIHSTAFKFILTLFISVSIATAGSGVRGIVTNSYGFPLSGVLVCALEAEKGETCWTTYWQSRRMMVTDSYGSYCMDLPTGYYSIYATMDSIVCYPGTVFLVGDDYLNVDLSKEITLHEPGSVSGMVTDQNGHLLHGAYVSAQTYRAGTLTNSHGEYILAGLPPGMHSLEASYNGMRTITIDSVLIFPSRESVYNFDTDSGRSLPDTTGRIIGIVENVFSEPIVNCTVMVDGTSIGAMTDSTGAYCIRLFEPGKYTITASYIGCIPAHSPIIEVIIGEVFEYNFDPSTYLESDSTGGALKLAPFSGTVIRPHN